MSTTALPTQSSDFPALVRRGRTPRRARRELVRSRRDGDQAVRLRDLGGDPARARRPDQGDRPREPLLPAADPRFAFWRRRPSSSRASHPRSPSSPRPAGSELEEPLVVRPTSEAMIWSTYARWVQSYRDLPLLYNQWANVVRWELRPRLFLRTSEFLWQEGHTAHETEQEAIAETLTILHDVYADMIESVLAIPVLRGRKSESERFPGAVETYTLEALMRDGKALQAATSHYLGQGFARAFDVRFTGRDGSEQHPYRNLVGRDHPPRRRRRDGPRRRSRAAAPASRRTAAGRDRADRPRRERTPRCSQAAAAIAAELRAAGVRVRVDDRPEHRPGFKFNEWELKGAPLRVELGAPRPRGRGATVARRDTGGEAADPACTSRPRRSTSSCESTGLAPPDGPRRTGTTHAPESAELRRDDRVPP